MLDDDFFENCREKIGLRNYYVDTAFNSCLAILVNSEQRGIKNELVGV